jgi:hypothetical protein
MTSLALALSACGEDSVQFFQPVTADPSFPGNAGDSASYASLLAYKPDPACAPNVPRKLDRKTEIRIFRGYGIDMDMTARFVSGLKRYYDYYGVDIFTRHDVIQVPLDHAMVLSSSAISDWMIKNTTQDPSCANSYSPTTACQQAMGAAMFYNVKQFFHAYAEPEQNVINVVLLKRVIALQPDPSEEETAWGVAGLGLSEELVNSVSGSDVSEGSLADVLDETSFSPTVFLGVNLIDFVLSEPDMVVAHEFGHAYGLEHIQSDKTNLMYPVVNECNQSLNSSQLTTIEQATTKYGNTLLAAHDDPLGFLSFEHRAGEILDIVRKRVGAKP